MFVYKGAGFVVPVIAFGTLVATELLVERGFGDDRYYQHHGWPKFAGLMIAAIVVLAVGRAMNRREAKTLVEKDTGREIVQRPEHTFFFVNVEHWGYLLILFALVFAFVRTE